MEAGDNPFPILALTAALLTAWLIAEIACSIRAHGFLRAPDSSQDRGHCPTRRLHGTDIAERREPRRVHP